MPEKLSSGPRISQDLSKTGAGLSRGENRQKQMVVAPFTGQFPAPGATLDLDFANNRGYVRGLGQGGVMDGITFSRASNANYVGQDGLLKSYSNQGALGKNLLTFPQDFDNAAWGKSGATVIPNCEMSPVGTNSSDFLIESSASALHYLHITPTIWELKTYTISLYAKTSYNRYLQVSFNPAQFGGEGFGNFNLQSGIVTKTGSSASASIENIGNGWYRCSVTATCTSTSGSIPIYFFIIPSGLSDWAPSYQGDGISGIYIWGAQFEVGDTATPYYPTNIGSPRFDWASTEQVANRNLLRYTEDFTAWSKSNVTVNPDQVISPDGLSTADKLIESSGLALHEIYQSAFSLTPGVEYVFSFYGKSAERSFVQLLFGGGTTSPNSVYANFDLTNGLVTVGNNIGNISLENNGFFRCSIRVTPTGTSLTPYIHLLTSGTDGRNASYSGDGTSGIYIWGAQLELGNAATPYQAITQPPTNTPLLPSSSCNGILIEESRTNRILWCRDATQANWVCANTTPLLNQTGIDGVSNAATSLTATANNGTCIQTITLASGSRTGSVYLKRLTGTGIIQVSLDGTSWSTVDLSETEWRRIVLSGTVTNPVVGIKIVTSGDSVTMDFAQIEDGSFATSPIMTTNATATRSAEVCSIPTKLWYNKEGTFFIDATKFSAIGRFGLIGIGFFGMSGGGGGASNNLYANYSQGFLTTSTTLINGNIKAISSFSRTRTSLVFNFNGTIYKDRFINYSAQVPDSINCYIGNYQDGTYPLNGYIKRVFYFQKPLNDISLESLVL